MGFQPPDIQRRGSEKGPSPHLSWSLCPQVCKAGDRILLLGGAIYPPLVLCNPPPRLIVEAAIGHAVIVRSHCPNTAAIYVSGAEHLLLSGLSIEGPTGMTHVSPTVSDQELGGGSRTGGMGHREGERSKGSQDKAAHRWAILGPLAKWTTYHSVLWRWSLGWDVALGGGGSLGPRTAWKQSQFPLVWRQRNKVLPGSRIGDFCPPARSVVICL